ncbi:hypothetical protein ACA910_005421 [Epithemia clementina (nom. ined.)]
MGSSTLYDFFKCAGLRANHGMNGQCFAEAKKRGLPLLSTRCDSPLIKRSMQTQRATLKKLSKQAQNANQKKRFKQTQNANRKKRSKQTQKATPSLVQAWMQMDINYPPDGCYYPQMSMLEDLHREAPNATFVLNFRPLPDWWRSIQHWFDLQERLVECNLPGLPSGRGRNLTEIQDWWCQHVQRVREFVRQHPSHTLVELDLYNTNQSSLVMAELFQTKSSCWGHANANPRVERLREEEEEEEEEDDDDDDEVDKDDDGLE